MGMIAIVADIVAALKRHIDGPMTTAKVEAKLTELAAASGEKLEPLTSLTDLQKVLELPSNFPGRRQAWIEFGCEGEYTGSAEQNIKLHDLIMEEIARGDIELPKPE